MGNVVGNSVRNSVENSVGNAVGNSVGNAVGNSAGNVEPIFKICTSSRSTSCSFVKVKYSFLKPIRNRFLHITS